MRAAAAGCVDERRVPAVRRDVHVRVGLDEKGEHLGIAAQLRREVDGRLPVPIGHVAIAALGGEQRADDGE